MERKEEMEENGEKKEKGARGWCVHLIINSL